MTLPPTDGILNLLVRLWHHLSCRRQCQFGLVLALMLVSVFADVISLGAVLPFLGVLVDPETVLAHPIVSELAQGLGINSAEQLVLPVTILFASAALVAGAVRTLLYWVNSKFGYAIGADLSIEVYRRTLYQPYHVHITQNSSEVISGITAKVNGSVAALIQFMTFVSSIGLMMAVAGTLIAIDTLVALTITVIFSASYSLVYWQSRRRLMRNGECIAREQTMVIKALQEGLGGIRDVLLDGSQEVYCNVYRRADVPLRRALGDNVFISGSPRFIMETLAMLLIAALTYSLSNQSGGIAKALPMLGALALGAQRLLPALQAAYGAWTHILGAKHHLSDTMKFLDYTLPAKVLQLDTASEHLPLKNAIEFKEVNFRYGIDGPWVLEGLSLTIPKGSRVGFVGSTGSGKTTLLDLLMGLLQPTEGEFLVDSQPMTVDRVRAWQRTITHVPQNIFLADSTLAENIAFGIPPEQIDLSRVRKAARQAQIADYIESRSEGYEAFVGERGIRLSGGQRQRIGIARALYKEASVLVFDEATSALDNATEQLVMKSFEGLNRDLTVLLIAHRLTTVQNCDFIVELGEGKVVAQGTYEQLFESSPSFREMARAKD